MSQEFNSGDILQVKTYRKENPMRRVKFVKRGYNGTPLLQVQYEKSNNDPNDFRDSIVLINPERVIEKE